MTSVIQMIVAFKTITMEVMKVLDIINVDDNQSDVTDSMEVV